ncbi:MULTISPECIES: helix-turn-helix transcriptional regulator [unclassified Streptomyces]|uniref:helix-turn-helix domain-containing protein n=1 Tax=unclassified Streptomyces TaxID=2593676 RepID=UPI000DC7CB9C|nr:MULTISPECIES: helix-turn-helix transcriptional regulator [unclassified Streptomyces]AWZ06189.1 transcriptional regulator [Streptomyces sp. ICC4]AWZ13811.1 transcriptional regulator [Streptomyces sp. ICC1]
MPASPSSSAQAAREAVAARLRDLRRGAGLTVAELAGLCGWHHSKTSRIENGRTAPSAGDIRRWCGACGHPDEAADLVVRSMSAESMYSEWRHQVQELKKLQNSWPRIFAETQLFRIYSSTLVPGVLQAEGYAAGLLGTIARFRGYPEEGDEAARARVDRSRIIHDPGRRAVLVVEETALYYRMGNPDATAAQLGYLLTAGALPAVSLGVIPRTVEPRTMWPVETFHVYDDAFVSVELLSAEVNITQPSEVGLYLKAFEELRRMAVYGADARALVMGALAELQ